MELTGFERNCVELLNGSPKRHSRYCFRSALNHLEKSWKLVDLDPEMTVFRAITAEEEAASGLMHVLKERGYANSEKLKPRDHVQKHAVVPFLSILGDFFEEIVGSKGIKPVLHVKQEEGERRLMLGLPISITGENQLAYPVPPLNFSVSSEEKRLSYRRQIDAFLRLRGAKDITSHVRDEANLRNRVLYAAPDGYPRLLDLKPEFVLLRKKRVFAMLMGYLFIYPYREIQPFVQDALDAFLSMLGMLPETDLHEEV